MITVVVVRDDSQMTLLTAISAFGESVPYDFKDSNFGQISLGGSPTI
jgi:hypothetical protein